MAIPKDLETRKLSPSLHENVAVLNAVLGVGKSFDVLHRQLVYCEKACALYFVDGLAKDEVMTQVMRHLANLRPEDLSVAAVRRLLTQHLAYIELGETERMEEVVTAVLSGPLVLLIDGEASAVIIDARTYPARGPEELDLERVVRGSRDGFVETIIFNTALTRRRLRDPSLRMEHLSVGRRSKTDIVLAYMEDLADPELVDELRRRLQDLDIDGLPMAEKTLEEYLFKRWWNPYPMVRYTERPDVAAVHLLEGHVLIYVDTSPSVMITPTTLIHHVQHAEEYRQKPVVGVYLRWVRFLLMLASVFLPPLWLLAVLEPALLPAVDEVVDLRDAGKVPLFWQFLAAELGIDALRMAAIHTPSALATAMGLVAAVLIGETAVKVGLFTHEVVLYIAIAAVGTFATPSYELGLANRLVRLALLVLVWVGHAWGLLLGLVGWFALLATTRSLNTPYLWPLLPFHARALWQVFVRTPVPANRHRFRVITAGDTDRQRPNPR